MREGSGSQLTAKVEGVAWTSGDLKRFFIATVPAVERFGMNRRMFFRRIAFDLPLHVRSNLVAFVPYAPGPARPCCCRCAMLV